MPGWVDTPAEEKAWKKAKAIVSRQRKKSESDFRDKDWALCTHIAKNILKSSMMSASVNDGTVYALANVERILDNRRKRERRERDSLLSASDQTLVTALSQVAALGSQTISALRDNQASGLSAPESDSLASELQAVAAQLRDVLLKVKS